MVVSFITGNGDAPNDDDNADDARDVGAGISPTEVGMDLDKPDNAALAAVASFVVNRDASNADNMASNDDANDAKLPGVVNDRTGSVK